MFDPPDDSTHLSAVSAAAQRLAERLRHRHAASADMTGCSDAVPRWWREGVATAAIFGDGLLSFPAATDSEFSRPVAMLSTAEISMAAGGEYVPLAWVDAGVDGGASIALVHDQGDLPVVVVAPNNAGAAPGLIGVAAGAEPERLADSLSVFLDRLMPQTLCRFQSGESSMSVELCDETSLLIERDGQVERRDFDSADDVGAFVATFMAEALDAGMRIVTCPAKMRPLVASYSGQGQGGSNATPPEVRAAVAVRRLLVAEALELVEDADMDELIDDASRYIERHSGQRGQSGIGLARGFAEWLMQHPAVEELYADDQTVHTALESAPPVS